VTRIESKALWLLAFIALWLTVLAVYFRSLGIGVVALYLDIAVLLGVRSDGASFRRKEKR
jgi:hypothetical protein